MINVKIMNKQLKLAETLSKKNGGKLPNPQKMIQQGYGGLYRYINRNPKRFNHMPVEQVVGKEHSKETGHVQYNVSIRNEHIQQAKKLARQNRGVLQTPKWLIENGYTRLASYVKTYPHVFVKNKLTHRKH